MKDFLSILQELQNTPVPLLLVGGGILFLFVAVGGQIGGKISTGTTVMQRTAAGIGGVLLLSGIALYIVPIIVTPSSVPTSVVDIPQTKEIPTEVESTQIASERGNLIQKGAVPLSFSLCKIIK